MDLPLHSCNGFSKCQDATLQCNDNSCSINCIGTMSCAGNAVIEGGSGDLQVICDGQQACEGNTVINCGSGGSCSVVCTTGEIEPCKDTTVNLQEAISFSCTGLCPSSFPSPFTDTTPQPSPTPITTTSQPSTSPSKDPSNHPSTDAIIANPTSSPINEGSIIATNNSSISKSQGSTNTQSNVTTNLALVISIVGGVMIIIGGYCMFKSRRQQKKLDGMKQQLLMEYRHVEMNHMTAANMTPDYSIKSNHTEDKVYSPPIVSNSAISGAYEHHPRIDRVLTEKGGEDSDGNSSISSNDENVTSTTKRTMGVEEKVKADDKLDDINKRRESVSVVKGATAYL